MMPIIGKRSFFSLIRWKNLLLIILTQWLFSYFILNINIFYSHPIVLTIVATILIAAAGNIINDYFDIDTDKINKPEKQIIGVSLSKNNSLYLYIIFNVIAIVIASYIGFTYNKFWIALLFLAVILMLYFYSYIFKRKLLIGNLIISLLSALPLLYIWLICIQIEPNQLLIKSSEKFLYFYMFFAFLMTFIREIIKDIEDIEGDKKSHCKTLPIILGVRLSKKIALTILISVDILVFFTILNLTKLSTQLYFILLILTPLLGVTYLLIISKKKKDFHNLSQYIKFVMMTGILSMAVV